MHVNAHPITVDVADLQIQGFMEPETTCVDSGQIGFVLGCTNRMKDSPNLVNAEHGWQSLFTFCMYKCQGVSVTFKYIDKEEFDTAVADTHRGR